MDPKLKLYANANPAQYQAYVTQMKLLRQAVAAAANKSTNSDEYRRALARMNDYNTAFMDRVNKWSDKGGAEKQKQVQQEQHRKVDPRKDINVRGDKNRTTYNRDDATPVTVKPKGGRNDPIKPAPNGQPRQAPPKRGETVMPMPYMPPVLPSVPQANIPMAGSATSFSGMGAPVAPTTPTPAPTAPLGFMSQPAPNQGFQQVQPKAANPAQQQAIQYLSKGGKVGKR